MVIMNPVIVSGLLGQDTQQRPTEKERGEYKMSEARLYTEESWLRKRYLGEKLSAGKMGALCSVQACTVKRWLRQYGIPLRSFAEARHVNHPVSRYRNKKFLYRVYWKQNHTLREIAVLCGRDRTTVRDWFRELNIPVRTMVEARINRKRTHGTWYERLMEKVKAIITSLDSYMREKDN